MKESHKKDKIKLKTEIFINKCKKIHGEKYNYEQTKYSFARSKIKIICYIHGIYKQHSHNHLKGYGCPKCGIDSKRECNNIVNMSKSIHGENTFDYSLVIPVKHCQKKVKLICNLCKNKFEICYMHHIHRKQGCPKCSYSNFGKRIARTNDQFILKAIEVHGNKYDYSKCNYKNSKTKVVVVCEKHGDFLISPNNHIHSSSGCLKCNPFKISKGELKIKEFLIDNNIEFYSQKTFKDLFGINNKKKLQFDFYLPNYNLLIEFDGIQHYNKKCKWYSIQLKENDKKKRRYCKYKNINLLRIRYHNLKKINNILIEYLHLYS
jgi:hypothetical protein